MTTRGGTVTAVNIPWWLAIPAGFVFLAVLVCAALIFAVGVVVMVLYVVVRAACEAAVPTRTSLYLDGRTPP